MSAADEPKTPGDLLTEEDHLAPADEHPLPEDGGAMNDDSDAAADQAVIVTDEVVADTDEVVADTDEVVADTDDTVVDTGEAVVDPNGAPADPEDAAPPDVAGAVGEGAPMLANGAPADSAHASAITTDDAPDDLTVEEVPRMDLSQLKAIVEALVFASPEPLTPRMLLKLLNDEPKEDVLAAIEAVRHDYVDRPGLHMAEVAGGYQITTRPEFHDWVRRLFHERTTQKLSVASLETLSVIAYKQPITQAEIGEIRGVNASGVLSTLLERHLIKIVGRKNVIGRPFLYGTTREFLIRFGLKDVYDLPRIEDMAQQLGFDPPAVLMEQNVPEEMLPLEEEMAEPAAEPGEGD